MRKLLIILACFSLIFMASNNLIASGGGGGGGGDDPKGTKSQPSLFGPGGAFGGPPAGFGNPVINTKETPTPGKPTLEDEVRYTRSNVRRLSDGSTVYDDPPDDQDGLTKILSGQLCFIDTASQDSLLDQLLEFIWKPKPE